VIHSRSIDSEQIDTQAAPSLDGQFGPKGALYSGWESRRHNPAHDWCIVKLGATGVVHGLDIDTSHFNGSDLIESTPLVLILITLIGNEAPEVSVDALLDFDGDDKEPKHDDPRVSHFHNNFIYTNLLTKTVV
jgi:allantoicase